MKNAGYICRLALTLLAITALVAAALAGVNALTKDRIAQGKAEKIQAAVRQVLEGDATAIALSGDRGMVVSAYKSQSGYAVEVAPEGFGGKLTMMVGVANDGTVTGIRIISHAETAGLGAVAAEASAKGEAFRSQFAGKSGELQVSKEGGQIDCLTGATITSKAVTQGVNAALAFVKEVSL